MSRTAAEVALQADGLLVGEGGALVTSFTNDSRVLEAGACFVALRAARDGHDFVPDAYARGASTALVGRRVSVPRGGAAVVVDDPLAGLGRVATHTRAQWDGTRVVGITGSAGKTATKDLAAAALSPARAVHASPGSFNNEAGLPLTLLGTPPGTEVVVAELGARFRGNIADLCAIARPDVGVVTHVGLAHAEHLGGPEGILATKAELVEALPREGLAVLNADDAATPELRERTDARVVQVGTAPAADVVVRELVLDAELRPRFTLDSEWGSRRVELAVRGSHQALNAAMAAAVALALGVPLDLVVDGLARAGTAPWRMHLARSPGGITVLNDAYNASPSSMRAALLSFEHLQVTGRRIAVLGDMLELGEHSEHQHAALADLAATTGVDVVIAVGSCSRALADRAADRGLDVLIADDPDSATVMLRASTRPGDAVLVKASRAVGLETVADAVLRGEVDP